MSTTQSGIPGGAEVLASATASLPPIPPASTLGTTVGDVGGLATLDRVDDLSQQVPLDGKSEKDLSLSPSFPSVPKPRLSTAHLIGIASIATFSMIMSTMGSVLLNIALPTIEIDLSMRPTDLQWISAAYSLTFGCFLLLAGRLADIHGRKLVFLVGVGWFTIWTLVGPFFKNGAGLVVSRALAGIGASMATPSSIGIVAANFDGRSRATAFAVFSAGAPIGGSFGLLLGGLLTEYAPTTWKAALWVTAAFGVSTVIAAYYVLPADVATTSDRRVDWIGAILVTVGLVLLQFAISSAETASHGWKTGYVIALLIIGIILVALFFFWERQVTTKTSRPPLMRLELWTRANGKLAAVYMIGFVSWMGFVSISYHATLFYQQVQMLSPVQAMLRFMPMSVSGVICNIIVAYSIGWVPTQVLICIGILATGIASVLFALAPATTSYWTFPFNGMWLCVLGADFLMATAMLFVSRLALPEEQSVAGALFQTLVQLGGSFGLAFTTVISTSYQIKARNRGENPVDAQLKGIHAAFWLGAGCSFAALIVALVALRGMGTIGKIRKEESDKETSPCVHREQSV